MSKAVTNEEVEDVLSSIRRLVSEDKRPLAGLRSAVAEPVEVAAPKVEAVTDRLVLTPALRVLDRQDAPRAESDDDPLDLASVARETWAVSDDTDASSNGPMVLFPTSQVVASHDDDDHETDLTVLVQDALETETQSEAAGSVDDAFEDDAVEDADYSDEEYWNIEETSEDTHDDAAAQRDEIEEHTFVDEMDMGADRTVSSSDFTEDNVDEVTPVESNEVKEELFFEPVLEDKSEAVAGDDTHGSTIPLTDKIAALEVAVDETTQEWEPDGDEINELSAPDAPTMVWEDDIELDAKGAPIQDAFVETKPDIEEVQNIEEKQDTTSTAAPVGTSFGNEDQMIDEEALRDLVSEIVRAELQGALGERITRNVRKLVRREIHRALTAQELD